MKKLNRKKIVFSLALVGMATAQIDCGGAQQNAATAPAPAPVAGSVGGLPAGCLPIGAPIGFNATNIYYNQLQVIAGNAGSGLTTTLNTPSSAGTVTIMSGGSGGAYSTLPGRPDGSISMNINLVGNPQAAVGVTSVASVVNATGVIMVSALKQAQILGSLYSYPGIQVPSPTVTTTSPLQSECVSAVAFNLHIGNAVAEGGTNQTLYNGYVYLQVNNSQVPVMLDF